MPEVYPEPQSISHQELFLFQFANSHCVKKVLSCYRPEKELNRTPTVEPEITPIPDGELAELRMAYKNDGVSEYEIDVRIKGYESNRSITRNGTIYNIVGGKPICIGTTFFNHELFNTFCHQHGIEGVSNDQGLILWEHCQQALKAITDNNERHTWERCIRGLYNECTHKETFQLEIYRQLMQVFERVKDIRVKLKQCPCCGCFWIETSKAKGKPSVFCCKECRVQFGRASREKASETEKANREAKRANEKIRILDWLCDEKKYSKPEAIRFYDRRRIESARSVTSLKEFKRTYIW